MKQYLTLAAHMLLLFFFFACKEQSIELPDTSKPDPADTAMQRNFKLVFENLNGQWNGSESLTANMTVENPQTPKKKIQLSATVVFDTRCSTPLVKLPKGNYKIQQLIINNAAGITRFAAPIAGSLKAAQISKPLSIALVLEDKADKEVAVQVLPVTHADTPESFGYPAGAFGKDSSNPQPPMDKRVFIRPIFRVGEVVYDSIPVQLVVKSWDAKNEMDYGIHSLKAGTQAIYLSAKAVRFQLSVTKWGSVSELALLQSEVKENAVYDIGGQIAAKKLKSVIEVKIVEGVNKPQTKTDYEYHPNGEIKQRNIWGKRADQATYLMQKDIFTYTNGNITAIESYDEKNRLIKTLTARYNNERRVVALEETANSKKTKVTASYLPLETRSGITQDYRIEAQYDYANGAFTDYYNRTMRGGSTLHDIYVNNNGTQEEGTYDYDFGINPYVHLALPEMLFGQYTKHNLIFARKIRRGVYPEDEPYDFKYTYDADGYPKELLTRYRSTGSKMDSFVLRTIFSY